MSTCCIRPTSTEATRGAPPSAGSSTAIGAGWPRRKISTASVTTSHRSTSRGRNARLPRSARVWSSRSSTRPASRRTCERANARSSGATGLPASSCRSASWSVIASGPSAFLISCAAAASDTFGSATASARAALLAGERPRFVMRARRWRRSPARRRCTSSPARSGRAGGRARAPASSPSARPRSRGDGRGRSHRHSR